MGMSRGSVRSVIRRKSPGMAAVPNLASLTDWSLVQSTARPLTLLRIECMESEERPFNNRVSVHPPMELSVWKKQIFRIFRFLLE